MSLPPVLGNKNLVNDSIMVPPPNRPDLRSTWHRKRKELGIGENGSFGDLIGCETDERYRRSRAVHLWQDDKPNWGRARNSVGVQPND
jgi:hypothetical protein